MKQISRDKAEHKRPLTQEQKLALVGRLRIGDLNKLFRDRYGGNVYPDDDDGRHSLMILLQHYARNNPLKVMKIIEFRAPWMPQDEIDELLGEIADNPRSWRAKTLGRELNFTGSEWRRLRLRTIAPINMTKAERDQDTRLRKRQRMRIKRREENRTPRAAWLAASKSRTKPWIAAGFHCRRTWERHGKPAVSQVCAHKDKSIRHTPATKPNRRQEVVRQEPMTAMPRSIMDLLAMPMRILH
jgi:hypothetical protein